MSRSAYKGLCAAAWGIHILFFGVWSLAFALMGEPTLAIFLGCGAAFCVFGCRVQLRDRRIAKQKAEWLRQSDSADWQYENLTLPAGTGETITTRDAG